jgi:hypothetical protein
VGDKIISVDGRPFSGEALVSAVAQPRDLAHPILLQIEDPDRRSVSVVYPGGLRYPHLEPSAGARRRLDEILAPTFRSNTTVGWRSGAREPRTLGSHH